MDHADSPWFQWCAHGCEHYERARLGGKLPRVGGRLLPSFALSVDIYCPTDHAFRFEHVYLRCAYALEARDEARSVDCVRVAHDVIVRA